MDEILCIKICPGIINHCEFINLASLEQKHGDSVNVKVDKVFALVRHIAAKVSADDAMPGRSVLFVRLLFDVGGDVLFQSVLFHRSNGRVDDVGLHSVHHVRVFDRCLSAFFHKGLEIIKIIIIIPVVIM